jgi:hypothetical protein
MVVPCISHCRRRHTNGILYPNAVAGKRFGIPTIVRNWNTIATICDILEK